MVNVRYMRAVRQSTGGRKQFNVQRIIIILKHRTTILRIMQVIRRLATFLHLCVVRVYMTRSRPIGLNTRLAGLELRRYLLPPLKRKLLLPLE